ncbi:MAG: hypothetical protein KJ000_23950 [Pirellulaceae bacterium]|nr:hypothetical protein [Pirellulaceae bacterium]
MVRSRTQKSKRQLQQIDTQAILWAAGGRWLDILERVGGIPRQHLDHKHHPCPKCGGRDRFRLIDERDGAVLCNQCGRSNGDGIASVRWATGLSFPDTCKRICEFIGIEVPVIGHQVAPQAHQRAQTPAVDQLAFQPWNENLVHLWCRHKPPITPAAVQSVGGKLARYLGQFTVVALPVWGEKLTDGEPVGWVLYNTTGRGLPVFERGSSEPTGWVKVKTLPGTGRGWIGNVQDLQQATTVWKLEGPSDVLGLLSVADRPADVAVVTNVHGCGENPAGAPWMLESLHGRAVNVCHDADKPGQDGATTRDNRPGWAPAIATTASECRNVVLPYEIQDDHGPDIRDWLNEGHGYQDLVKLADGAPVTKPAANADSANPLESVDDPYRLARLFRKAYDQAGNPGLHWHRDEWYSFDGVAYQVASRNEIRAGFSRFIKAEFDRYAIEKLQSGSDEDCTTKKVTQRVVNDALRALESECILPGKLESPAWIGRGDEPPPFPARECIITQSGILHVSSVGTSEECLVPCTPALFSTNGLPYGYDCGAGCDAWMNFLGELWSHDPQSIDALQEWFGYFLLRDTRQHKLLMLVGAPRCGKGTIGRVLTAMIGRGNCGNPTLASLAGPFGLWQLVDKLAAIIADARLSVRADAVAVVERLLSITGEDAQNVDRKSLPTMTAVHLPTRFMILTNELPGMKDASGALLTRVILLKLTRSFLGHEDQTLTSKLLTELPGILNWSIRGLQRLRKRGFFLQPESGQELLSDLSELSSPVRAFLDDQCIFGPGYSVVVGDLFDAWRSWCDERGRDHPGTMQSFGRDLRAVRPEITVTQRRVLTSRERFYEGIGLKEGF